MRMCSSCTQSERRPRCPTDSGRLAGRSLRCHSSCGLSRSPSAMCRRTLATQARSCLRRVTLLHVVREALHDRVAGKCPQQDLAQFRAHAPGSALRAVRPAKKNRKTTTAIAGRCRIRPPTKLVIPSRGTSVAAQIVLDIPNTLPMTTMPKTLESGRWLPPARCR